MAKTVAAADVHISGGIHESPCFHGDLTLSLGNNSQKKRFNPIYDKYIISNIMINIPKKKLEKNLKLKSIIPFI